MLTLIAEVGLSHNGDLLNAIGLAEHCLGAAQLDDVPPEVSRGSDFRIWVKTQDHYGQKHNTRNLGSLTHPHWMHGGDLENRSDYLFRTEWSDAQWAEWYERVPDSFASCFSVEALRRHGPAVAYKIASGQVTNKALYSEIVASGKQMLVSLGMTPTAVAALMDLAVDEYEEDSDRVVLMECESAYPSRIPPLKENGWGMQGFSDHSPAHYGAAASAAAIALGATYIERHVCWKRGMHGTDTGEHCLEPDEWDNFVEACVAVYRGLGKATGDQSLAKDFLHVEAR